MKSIKNNRLANKILMLAVLPAAILFAVSFTLIITTLTKDLSELIYKDIYSAGRGMELTITSITAEIPQTEVLQVFSDVSAETGCQYVLYVGDHVYATSIKDESGNYVTEALDPELYEKVCAGETVKNKNFMIDGERYFSILYPCVQQGEVFGAMFVGKKYDEVSQVIKDAPKASFYASFIILLIGIACSVLVIRTIKNALGVTNKSVEKLASGDMTKLEGIEASLKSSDELGDVVRNVDSLQKELNSVLSEVLKNAEELVNTENQIHDVITVCNTASNEISGAVGEISQGSTTQARELEAAKGQVDTMEVAIDDISENINQSNELVKMMMDSSSKTQSVFDEFIEANKHTKEIIDKITTQINNSADSSNQIVQAVEMINEIASQTSLLSLNASIEAARAGEAGKGFAVVADEIKKLSEQSAASAQDIKEVISALTKDNQLNITMSNELKETIEAQTGILQQSVEELRNLLNYINETKVSLATISEHNTRVTDAKSTLVATIDSLSTIADGNAAASEQTTATMQELNSNVNLLNESSNQLHKMAESLRDSLGHFKL